MSAPYAPHHQATDPIRLASVTIKAVDQIGGASAEEIEQAAASIEEAAKEIADKLRRFAASIRDQSVIASELVAQFCNKATSAIETARAIDQSFNPPPPDTDDGKPAPAFLTAPRPPEQQ